MKSYENSVVACERANNKNINKKSCTRAVKTDRGKLKNQEIKYEQEQLKKNAALYCLQDLFYIFFSSTITTSRARRCYSLLPILRRGPVFIDILVSGWSSDGPILPKLDAFLNKSPPPAPPAEDAALSWSCCCFRMLILHSDGDGGWRRMEWIKIICCWEDTPHGYHFFVIGFKDVIQVVGWRSRQGRALFFW